MFDFMFKKEDTPVVKLATVEAKLAELAVKKSDLQDKIDELEMRLTKSLVSEALQDKSAAAESDKLTLETEKVRRELKAVELAHTELTDQLPHLQEAAEVFEHEQKEQAIMDDAAAKLKALPAAVKAAEKAAAAYAKAMADVADLSRHAATVIEEQTSEQLRGQYQVWRGFVNFDRLTEYHYLGGMQRAEHHLKQIAEFGSRGREAELPYQPTEAELSKKRFEATAAHTRAQHMAGKEYQNNYSEGEAA